MDVEDLSLNRAFVGIEVREIQKPRGKECACLKTISAQKCRVVPYRFFSGFNALASSGTYLIRPVLTSNFTSFGVGSGNISSCTISCSVFSRSASFL